MVHVNALGFKYVKIVGKIFLSDIEEYIKSHIYHPAEISFIDVRIYSLLFAYFYEFGWGLNEEKLESFFGCGGRI